MLRVFRDTFLGYLCVIGDGGCFMDVVVCDRRVLWRDCIEWAVLSGIIDSGSAIVEVVGAWVHDAS